MLRFCIVIIIKEKLAVNTDLKNLENNPPFVVLSTKNAQSTNKFTIFY